MIIKVFFAKVFDIIDDILAYIMTVVGIISSTYIPLLKQTGIINIKIDWWRIAISSLVALLVITKQERLDVDENGSKIKSKQGRKKRFIIRMANALSQGVMWNQIVQLAI